MHKGSAERRLAAILVCDIVGYSRLMGADETGTLRRLKALRREVLDPAIAAAHGRLVKTMGDGLLVEFPSPVRSGPSPAPSGSSAPCSSATPGWRRSAGTGCASASMSGMWWEYHRIVEGLRKAGLPER